MRSFASLLVAIMLVLTLLTGGEAAAAAMIEPAAMTATAEGHFEGDRDQSPADSHKGVPHHHAPCGEHQLAAETGGAVNLVGNKQAQLQPIRGETGRLGREPGATLRPPIA